MLVRCFYFHQKCPEGDYNGKTIFPLATVDGKMEHKMQKKLRSMADWFECLPCPHGGYGFDELPVTVRHLLNMT